MCVCVYVLPNITRDGEGERNNDEEEEDDDVSLATIYTCDTEAATAGGVAGRSTSVAVGRQASATNIVSLPVCPA